MKGVIVQVGEPKSIVLFNNGKLGYISTPAGCHVGMVVTVKLNNKLKIIALIFAAVFLIALGIVIGAAFLNDSASAPPWMHRYGNGHGYMMRRGWRNQGYD